jgi:uncharacterized Zn-finger protein
MRNLILAGHHSGCNCILCLKNLSSVSGLNYVPCQYCPENGIHKPCTHHKLPAASAPQPSVGAGSASSTTYVQLIPADSYVLSYPQAASSSGDYGNQYMAFQNSGSVGGNFIYATQSHPQVQPQAVYEYLISAQPAPAVQAQPSYSCTACGVLMNKQEVSSHLCRIPAPTHSQMINVSIQDSQQPTTVYYTSIDANQYQQLPPMQTSHFMMNSAINVNQAPKADTISRQSHSAPSVTISHPSQSISISASSSNDKSANPGAQKNEMSPVYQCQLCKRRFRTLEELEKHSIDHEDKPFKCEVCLKAFRQRRNLARHVRTHSQVKPFTCSVCGWAFRRKSNLAAHERIHSGMKPFVCEECGKSFRQKGSLSSHLRTHTKEKPHECPICGDLFTRKGSLQRHMARFHPNASDITSPQASNNKAFLKEPRIGTRSASVSSGSHTTHRENDSNNGNSSDEDIYEFQDVTSTTNGTTSTSK